MRLKKGKNQRINFKALLYRKLIKFFIKIQWKNAVKFLFLKKSQERRKHTQERQKERNNKNLDDKIKRHDPMFADKCALRIWYIILYVQAHKYKYKHTHTRKTRSGRNEHIGTNNEALNEITK